jgi:DNA-binding transcriptional ArsR family regulator
MGQQAAVIPFRAAEGDAYDPDRLRVRPDDIPAVKAETGAARKRKAARDRLFIPSTAWPELAAVVAAGMSGRAVGLWLAIRMQARLEGEEWVRVRTHLRESLGFTNRAAHSRAVTELERAGLIEVRRRKGYAPLVRLVPQRVDHGGESDG